MATKPYFQKERFDPGRHVVRQRLEMAKHYPSFTCNCTKRNLSFVGEICPSANCQTYEISVKLPFDKIPSVRILTPEIAPSHKYHMYSDGRLCLYKPSEQPWYRNDFLHEKIIPWTAEWVLFYEIYLRTGLWEGPEASHTSDIKVPQLKPK